MADERTIGVAFLDETYRTFRGYRRMADGALVQLADEEFFRMPDAESNNAALIVKHLAGNLRSRWSDFLTSDGEKPDRDRDQEFIVAAGDTRQALMQQWDHSWEITQASLQALTPDDLSRTVYIRREPFTVLQAICRSMAHTAYHVGQVLYLGKLLRGADWKTLSIPKGQSAAYNALKVEDRPVGAPAGGRS